MAEDDVDVVVVGGGVVGAAVAQALAAKGRSVIVLEAGPRTAEGVTSRNSGVVHSGLYYPVGSVKAQTCVRGNALLYEWCEKKGVDHAKCGKLVVARNDAQEASLDAMLKNALACDAPGVERIGRDAVLAREPSLPATSAVWCPETGIVDPTDFTRSLLADAEANGAMTLVSARVTAIERTAGGWQLETARGPVSAEAIVNAAGLYADEIAALAGITKYKIHPCRGDYFALTSRVKYRHLVYPAKDPTSPGLGVHLTLDLHGGFKLGPDVTWVEKKDNFADAPQKLSEFHQAAQRLLGPLSIDQLHYDSCGIRPKLRSPAEKDEKDFVVAQDLPGFVSMVGIESPGLTASLALAERVASML